MNCTGFVAYVTQKCGGNLTPIGKMGLGGGVCNASNWFRYFKNANIESYMYSSVSALLKSGKAEQGDIIYCEPVNWNQPGADCHITEKWKSDLRHCSGKLPIILLSGKDEIEIRHRNFYA